VPKSLIATTVSFASLLLLTQWTSAQQKPLDIDYQKSNLEPGIRVTIDLGANDAAKKEIEGSLAKMKLRDQASVDWRTFWRPPRPQRVISQGVTDAS